jgi:uncharacterized protein (TIGR03118 family)
MRVRNTFSSIMLKDYRFYLLIGLLFGFLAVEGCSSSTTTQAPAPPPGFAVAALTASSNQYGAANVDTMLKDAWGIAPGATGGFWIVEKGSSSVELFDTTGQSTGVRFVANGSGGTVGIPTGIVTSSLDSFSVGILGAADLVVSTLAGTISALPHNRSGDSLRLKLDRSGSSSYTGLAVARGVAGVQLFAPNIKNQSLDMIEPSFAPGHQIIDRNFSQGYTPFNVVVIDSQLYVAHAMKSGNFVQLGAAGAGHGIVDIYDPNGTYVKTLIAAGGKLNAPWGIAVAPANFGIYAGKLLVGNFGDGTINVYDKSSGSYQGTLNDVNGKPLVIDGLWALVVSNGTLYYTSGPEQGADGEFGKIAPR